MNRVLSVPNKDTWGTGESGIRRVVEAYTQYLPEFGWEIVTDPNALLDIVAVHAGLRAPLCHVAHLHGLYWTNDYDAKAWEWEANKRVVESIRASRLVTVPSEWVAEVIRREFRLQPTVIGHGMDLEAWGEPQQSVGYMLWNKNRSGDVCDPTPVGRLARAFPSERFVTTFAPKGDYPNMHITGVLPHAEMREVVKVAGCYLATTKETFGIGTLEALASGVPVLAFAHGGALDMVVHGVNGYLAVPNDYEDLAAGLDYILRHRDQLSQNALESVQEFTWPKQVAKVAAVYDKALLKPLPTVGIVIPCYNYAHKVRPAIESAIAQDYPLLTSIIVVDDGSEDHEDLKTVVSQYKDERLRLVRKGNGGVATARNHGIDLSDTTYVCCLDADDWIKPNFISVCATAMEDDPTLGIAYTGLRWHKPDGTEGNSVWPGDWDYDAQILRRNQVPTCCVFKKEMWRRLGGYRQRYAPQGAGSEDAEFWTRAGAYGFKGAKVTNDHLFQYSWMSGRVSGAENYKEVDWLAWHPWATKEGDKKHPVGSYARPASGRSHPVRQYDEPLVSVVIPVGPKHQQHLWDALDSLDGQTERKWEVIVVWDNNEPVEQRLRDAFPHIRFVHPIGGPPHGAGRARNEGAKVARAPFLVFLDADDYLLPQAIELMLEAWRVDDAIPYTDYLGKAEVHDVSKLAPDLQQRVYVYNERTNEALIGYRAADYDCDRAQLQPEQPYPFIWCNVTCLIPKTWHNEIGGFDESMASWEDVDYHWRMARAGKCYVRIDQELMVYRFHTGHRRQFGLTEHKSIVQYVQAKYAKAGEPVGCGCGRGRANLSKARNGRVQQQRLVLATPQSMRNEAMSDDQVITAKYLHPNRGQHMVVGAVTRTKYGMRAGGDVFLVNRQDAEAQPHLFKIVEKEPVPVPPQAVAPPPPPEPMADTLLENSGLSIKIQKALTAAGVTPADVVGMDTDQLVEIKGIGKASAAAILDALS